MVSGETIGGLYDSLPPEHWVDVPAYGVRVMRWAEPPARDPSTETWRELRRVEAELGSALSALSAARDLAEKLRIERDDAQAALADYLRKETTDG